MTVFRTAKLEAVVNLRECNRFKKHHFPFVVFHFSVVI